jgi:glucuronyl/N-acetylglucosaminyl transferase EXT2
VNQPLLSDGFTAVILTYSRLESLFEVIQLLSKVHSLSKIIVVWNHMEVSPPPLEEFPRIRQPLIVIRSSVNKLTNRFLSYPEIKTDAILCIDDDITMVTSEEIQFGFEV